MLLSVQRNVSITLPATGFKRTYLLDVIVQTPNGEVGNVIIFADAFRVLSRRRTKGTKLNLNLKAVAMSIYLMQLYSKTHLEVFD